IVMFMYALNGLNHHTHGQVPSFPMGWSLGPIMTEEPWRYLHHSIKNVNHIYFILVGMAFFMPNRVGFSVWFITIAYGIYEMFIRAYTPDFNRGMVHDHRNGAMIALAVMVLYLSRHHWRRVAGLLLRRVHNDADRLLKVSGWMVVTGAAGMFLWLQWAGVPWIWAFVFVFLGFMISLLIARIVAETGLPFVRVVGLNPIYFMAMLPGTWLTGAAIYMAGFISIIFPMGSRVSAAVMASHAAGVDEKASAKHQLRIGYLMIGLLLTGLVVCGAVHLTMGYSQPYTLDGQAAPINQWGTTRMRGPQNDLMRWADGAWANPSGRLGNLTFGLVLAGGLQGACMMIPRWPLHPIGLLLVGNFYGRMAWASIMFGWLAKVALLQYGGAGAYRRMKPVFLGLIMGEVFSAVIWTLVPVGLLLLGHDPADVGHIPLLPR
ncbi:MAG: DUF6785 family protein, partial [Phycisphaeraceae bacterium]|nr:DUF6785 family protein [Phycisphaeraceae bacterium]